MTDPIVWTVAAANPVIKPGQLHPGIDDRHAGACHVLVLGDRYRIYYWGAGEGGNVILMAESPLDVPNRWEPVGEALLQKQPETDYNCDGPSFPYVLPCDDGPWLMYFGAWGRYGRLPNTTGLALSADAGLSWVYHPDNPILPLDRSWDQSATGSVSVVRRGEQLAMYYTSLGPWFDAPAGVTTAHGAEIPWIGIGFALSDDGVSWQKDENGLMVEPRGHDADPYEYINSKPYIMSDGDGYRMWISTDGHAYRIRSLVSDDGLSWQRVPSGPDGDLGVGQAGAFDDHQRSYASVVKHGETYRMWFTGNGFGATGMGYAEGILGRT